MKRPKTSPSQIYYFTLLLVFLAGCTAQQAPASPTGMATGKDADAQATQTQSPQTDLPETKQEATISTPNNPDALSANEQISVLLPPDAGKEINETFSSLPSGGYILYSADDSLNVISEDGTFQQIISTGIIGIPISVDGRILAIINPANPNENNGYINLLTGEIKTFENPGAISPELKWIVQAKPCDPAVDQIGIEGYSTKADTVFCTYVEKLNLIKTDKVNELLSNFSWSADASKLAFTKITRSTSSDENADWSLLLSNAVFVTDTSCFQDPRTCDQKTKLAVFNPYKVTCDSINELSLNWSADGNYVVLNNGQMFVVFDLRNENTWKLEKSPLDLNNSPQYFGISPDNKWIAYSGDRTNIVLQPFIGGEEIEIASGMKNVHVLGWILAPTLESNATFKVLPGGDHARIRRTADIDGIQTGTLYKGNTFTVLEGPVQQDGYTWWYIHSNVDDVEGWVTEFYERYEKVE